MLAPLNDAPALSDRAYVSIREAILTLKIRPGQVVAIGDLADQLRISRTPVRDALLRLEKEGLVTINPRKGAYATPISIEDAKEIFELRMVLEGYATQQSAQRLTAADHAQLRDFLHSSEAAFQAGDGRVAADLGRQLHDVLMRTVQNRRLVAYLANLDSHYTRLRRFAVTLPGRFELSHEQHLAIVGALERGDGEAAGRIMADHLASVRDDVLAHIDMWMPHLDIAGNGREDAP